MKYFCNPINYPYKYQFNKKPDGTLSVSRESADPSMIAFKGKYYIFPSMTCGFLYSDNLAEWKFQPLKNFASYDYAPDVCVTGNTVVLSASSHEYGRFYRTKDLFSDNFEVIEFPFPFWDPALFADDDGRLYFYWGCAAGAPIYGLELDPETLQPVSEPKELILMDFAVKGFERRGENHIDTEKPPPEQVEMMLKQLESHEMPEALKQAARGYIQGLPFNEGAWMNKYNGKYYLQYATPGAQYNVYADVVYVSDKPLGEYTLAKNNPFSYNPGGFIPGAGHGSTMEDGHGRFWHTSTMRISKNHNFERRIGLWQAGFDPDGELFCDQRYSDFPQKIYRKPWEKPDFMLLSYGKKAKASSSAKRKTPDLAFDENVQTWWKAAENNPGEWLEVDLGTEFDVRAVQINFADDDLTLPLPDGAALVGSGQTARWIDEKHQPTRWKLEGSVDGEQYFIIEDKSAADTDLSHDFILLENGVKARYIKLTVVSLPYAQAACVSGLRVFGLGHGGLPEAAENVTIKRESDLDISVTWNGDAMGYNVLWGHTADKLYHSYIIFGKNRVNIGGLVKGQEVFVRVDSFNESGITEGKAVS